MRTKNADTGTVTLPEQLGKTIYTASEDARHVVDAESFISLVRGANEEVTSNIHHLAYEPPDPAADEVETAQTLPGESSSDSSINNREDTTRSASRNTDTATLPYYLMLIFIPTTLSAKLS